MSLTENLFYIIILLMISQEELKMNYSYRITLTSDSSSPNIITLDNSDITFSYSKQNGMDSMSTILSLSLDNFTNIDDNDIIDVYSALENVDSVKFECKTTGDYFTICEGKMESYRQIVSGVRNAPTGVEVRVEITFSAGK